MKNFLAILLCVGLLVLFVVGFGFIETGGFEEVVRGRPFDPKSLLVMFSPEHQRLTMIAGLVAAVFAVLDIQSLIWRVKTAHPSEPQPKSKPLAFVAVRARRYFLVPFVFAYAVLVIRTLRIPTDEFKSFQIAAMIAYGALFLTARRGLNTAIGDVFASIMSGLGEAGTTMGRYR